MNQLKQYLEKLEKTEPIHVQKAQEILQAYKGKYYLLDHLFLAAINRSYSQTTAFIHLIESGNYLSAAPMIRMQVDSILRLSASLLVSDPHEFSKDVLAGIPIRKMKTRDGKK